MKSTIARTINKQDQTVDLLTELKMAPNELMRNALNVSGALVGVEYEMAIPIGENIYDDDTPPTMPDFSQTHKLESVRDVLDFFEANGRSTLMSRLGDYLSNQTDFEDWWRERVTDRAFDAFDDHVRELSRNGYFASDSERNDYKESEWDMFYDYYLDQTDQTVDDFDEFLFKNPIDAREFYDYAAVLEWPIVHVGGGLSYSEAAEQIAEELAQELGKDVQSSGTYHGNTRTGKRSTYVVEVDSSINVDDDGTELPAEIVSPAQSFAETIEDFKKIRSWAAGAGAYTNASTGLHINVSVPNFDQVDWFKAILFLGDTHVLKSFGRQHNRFTTSSYERMMRSYKSGDIIIPKDFEQQWQLGAQSQLSDAAKQSFVDKYQSVHFRGSWVEFRSPGGNWLEDDLTKLFGTIARFIGVLTVASNTQLYQQEYAKKAFKFLQSINSANKNKPTAGASVSLQALRQKLIRQFMQLFKQVLSQRSDVDPREMTDISASLKQPDITPKQFLELRQKIYALAKQYNFNLDEIK